MKTTSATRPLLRQRRRAAVTLIECLVYIAALAVVLELAYSVFYRALDGSRHLGRAADDVAAALRTGELWRQDVRSATGAPVIEAGASSQLLHLPHSTGQITYLFRDGKLWRQAGPAAPWNELMSGIKSSSMQADPRRKVVAWRWELQLNPHAKSARVEPLFTFEAVPGH